MTGGRLLRVYRELPPLSPKITLRADMTSASLPAAGFPGGRSKADASEIAPTSEVLSSRHGGVTRRSYTTRCSSPIRDHAKGASHARTVI
jgi:hypothetical protein